MLEPIRMDPGCEDGVEFWRPQLWPASTHYGGIWEILANFRRGMRDRVIESLGFWTAAINRAAREYFNRLATHVAAPGGTCWMWALSKRQDHSGRVTQQSEALFQDLLLYSISPAIISASILTTVSRSRKKGLSFSCFPFYQPRICLRSLPSDLMQTALHRSHWPGKGKGARVLEQTLGSLSGERGNGVE